MSFALCGAVVSVVLAVCCTVLCCVAFRCVVLHCVVLRCVLLCCIALRCVVAKLHTKIKGVKGAIQGSFLSSTAKHIEIILVYHHGVRVTCRRAGTMFLYF